MSGESQEVVASPEAVEEDPSVEERSDLETESHSADAEGQEHSEDVEGAPPVEEDAGVQPVEVEPGPSKESSERAVGEPFVFRAYGTEIPLEGATRHTIQDPDGNPVRMLVMPEETFQRHILPNYGVRAEFQRREAEYQRKIAALDPNRNESVVRAKTLIDAVSQALESQEAFEAFATGFEQNRDNLMLKVEKAVLEAKVREREGQDARVQEEQQSAQILDTISADLPASVDEIARTMGITAPPAVLEQIKQYLGLNPAAYYLRATEEHAREYGFQVGQIVRNDALVAQTIRTFTGIAAASNEQRNKTEEAKKANAKALHPKKAPPVVTAKGSPAPQKKEKEMSKDEWRASMGLN